MEEVITKFLDKGYVISPSLIKKDIPWDDLLSYVTENQTDFVINEEILLSFSNSKNNTEPELDTPAETDQEIEEPVEQKPEAEPLLEPEVIITESKGELNSRVKIIKKHEQKNEKKSIKDFVLYYNERYSFIKNILIKRGELMDTVSISKMKDDGKVSLIGLVSEIRCLPNSFLLVLEDPTGFAKAIIPKTLTNKAGEIVHDEVIGITGTKRGKSIFVDNIIFPDVPDKITSSSPEEVYATFISDLHIGSKMFLPKEFERFIKWLNLKTGNEKQKEIAKKVRYLIVTGDLIDGVGVYPRQEKELEINDVYKQYEEVAKYLKQIPNYVKIIIAPGNHDAMRLAEPQPQIYKDFAPALYEMPNVTMVSNPAYVNIHSLNGFDGFNVLMYHGYSFDHFIANVPKLRAHGYERADLLMKFLLRKRHLAPTHGSTLIAPGSEDFLLIDKIPDIFVTAHIHKANISNYRKIITICSSCFQKRTAFQEKVGHVPEPAKVPIVDLKSRKVSLLNFGGQN